MALSVERDLLILAAAVYLGAVFSQLFRAFSSDIILPLLGGILPVDASKRIVVPIGNISVDIGDFVVELINAVFAFFVVILLLSFFRSYVVPAVPLLGGRK